MEMARLGITFEILQNFPIQRSKKALEIRKMEQNIEEINF